MKRNNKKGLKVIAGIIAIILILGILFVTNAFVGNPISAKLAERAINKYIEESYASLNLQVEKPVYNFKDGAYMARVKSNTSIDTNFSVQYRNGEVYYDSYEDNVLGLFNTIQRLSDEYTSLVRDIIGNDLGYGDNNTWVDYDDNIYENSEHVLELDMKFDRELPISARVVVNVEIDNPSLQEAASILVEAHKAFKENRCYFQEYDLFVGNGKTTINIMGVKPKDIERNDLLDVLEAALERGDDIVIEEGQDKKIEQEGIFVDIMEN